MPCNAALITISTRAALKRHHTYNLILGVDTGVGSIDWSLERIGTEAERLEVDRELAQLREQLAQVERWKARKEEIERELNQVWIVGEEKELGEPGYLKDCQAGLPGEVEKGDGEVAKGREQDDGGI